jgi:hypothetical protein
MHKKMLHSQQLQQYYQYPELYYAHEPYRPERLKSHSETAHAQMKLRMQTMWYTEISVQ